MRPQRMRATKATGAVYTSERKAEKFCYDIKIGEPVYVREINRYILVSRSKEKLPENSINICTKTADYDKIKGKIQLRTRQAGDTIGIKGGRKKIKELLLQG